MQCHQSYAPRASLSLVASRFFNREPHYQPFAGFAKEISVKVLSIDARFSGENLARVDARFVRNRRGAIVTGGASFGVIVKGGESCLEIRVFVTGLRRTRCSRT